MGIEAAAKQVAERLKGLGFSIRSISEPSLEEDGMVEITDMVHVQVGFNYAHVVSKLKDGRFKFYDEAPTYEQLAKDIRNAMTEA